MSYADKPPIIGIDLGTSTCLVAVHLENERSPRVLIADRTAKSPIMDSVFCYVCPNSLVGLLAANASKHPDHQSDAIRHVKRRMRKPDEALLSGGVIFNPVTISTCYLQELREAAEEQLLKIEGLEHWRGAIKDAVITVPAYFGFRERQATREAGAKAGLNVKALLEEPIAGAIGMDLQPQDQSRLILVIDLGGGTIDITLLRVDPDFREKGFYELGRIGDIDTGCIDWDAELARLVAEKVHGSVDMDLVDRSNIELYEACERAKKQFCSPEFAGKSRLVVQYKDSLLKHVVQPSITIEEFEEQTAELTDYCVRLCDALLSDVGRVGRPEDLRRAKENGRPHISYVDTVRRMWRQLLSGKNSAPAGPGPKGKRSHQALAWKDIDEVYMVGGGSHLTAFRRQIEGRWGRKPIVPGIPQHAIVQGAATYARDIWRRPETQPPYEKRSRSPHTIGYWWYQNPHDDKPTDFQAIIHRNAELPGVFEWPITVHDEDGAPLLFEDSAPLLFEIAEECISRFKGDGFIYQERGKIHVAPHVQADDHSPSGICRLNYSVDGDDISIEIEFAGRTKKIQLDPATLGPRGVTNT